MMALQQQTQAQQKISQAQSLAVVQTLLRAGLGCITFLRNLLPDDNFSESHFTTSDDVTPSSSQTSGSSSINGSRQRISGFKIMTMARGYSEEADRILDYLEYGIFDALEKQYLRSFIFAIYLDSKDPNNIVEAYTFNFRNNSQHIQYHKLPGNGPTIPIMTFGGSEKSTAVHHDPVTEAAEKGRNPTLRDVKKSVKTLLKTLIHAMGQMDVLPKRRYATFKVFYTDTTPLDYEPPHFQAGDVDKDRWYMMTHDVDEIPDKWSIGNIDTGYHAVNLKIASIATYLPSAEHQEGAFAGTMESQLALGRNLTPMQEAELRAQQNEQQEKDAETRNLVWAVENEVDGLDIDADGEDDPDYVRQPDGSFIRVSDSHVPVPLGIRNEAGIIESIPSAKQNAEAVYGGKPEIVPMHLNDLNDQSLHAPTEYDATQTYTFDMRASPLPPSDPPPPSSPISNVSQFRVIQRDSSFHADNVSEEDEASLLARMSLNDAIEAGETSATGQPKGAEDEQPERMNRRPNERVSASTIRPVTDEDKGLACECGVSTEDESCFCEGGCARWLHIWCIGYNSVQDKRIPPSFICFDCRLHADPSWNLIKSEVYPRLMQKYRDLALFRRAIKVAQRMNALTPSDFARQLGMDFLQSRQILKRLEEEGFIQEHVEEVDELGLVKSRPKKKGAVKQTKQRRQNMQKSQYRFRKTILNSPDYSKYFDPCIQTENRLLGIGEMVAKYHAPVTVTPLNQPGVSMDQKPAPVIVAETQTQEDVLRTTTELQDQITPTRYNKRPAVNTEEDRPPKKVKISVTGGVDLAE
ncbi:Meiosis-specific protein HOP1 [Leucoagaricus sp. SymC.cos]|nr:Meiosis-specific protein HOP1 [Leucoagaricus sp. SymC.cos]